MQRFWFIVLGFLCLLSSASAASFDCSRATIPRDRLICQTPSLSALDSELGKLYQQRRATLSPQGAKLLQSSQRDWLRYVYTVCPMTPASTADFDAEPANCLQMRYQERLTELAQVAQKFGPFVFNRVDIFVAEPQSPSDQGGSVPRFYVQHHAFPQIDNAGSAAAATWNKLHYEEDAGIRADCDSGLGDEDTDYQIGYASEHMTSVQWTDSEYCHGAAHGYSSISVENLVWDQNWRGLAPGDVFASGWETGLRKLFWNALTAKGWTPPNDEGKSEIDADVIEPSEWLFTLDGISESFSSYEGGCYACNPGTITVSWKDLKPLLAHGSVAR